MKINKACDLSSISVLPPHSRKRSSLSCSLPEMSTSFRQSQASSQQQRSQQSFSQGISSQPNAIFSQFSQNSQDEALTNDQLVASQDRENSVRRYSSLPPVNHAREESQRPSLSRSSTGVIRKWGSVSEQRCQMSEELEHRIGTIESSVGRFGLMLESLQTDIMQVNKGTKEVTMDMESIRQKLFSHDNSLQTIDNSVQMIVNSVQIINKGQEDIKSNLHGELKSLSDKLNHDKCHQNSQEEISVLFSGFEEKIEVFMVNLRNQLSNSFTNEIQAVVCKLKALDQKNPIPAPLPPKAVSFCGNPQGAASKNSAVPMKAKTGTRIPKVEMGTWNSVKREQGTLTNRDYSKGHKHSRVSQTQLEREWSIVIESDEESDTDFTCLSREKETDVGSYLMEKAKEETQRILRRARRRKRKQSNTIIIN